MTARLRTRPLVATAALLVLALSVCAVRGLRWPGFAEVVPFAPPLFHGVLEARSLDGLHFEVNPTPLRFPAETQHQALTPEGGRRLFFFDGHDEQLKVLDLDRAELESLDLDGDCDSDPSPGTACVDPCWLQLPDGKQLLYYVAAPRGLDPALSPGGVEVHVAVSQDGRHWRPRPGAVLHGRSVVDPDVVVLPDGRLRMYFTSVLGPGGQHHRDGLPAVYSAISDDGSSFEREAGQRLADASASATIALPGGGYRSYYHPFAGGIVSARSTDGLVFEREPGERLPADPLPGSRWVGSASPAVLAQPDGGVWMTLNAAREPWFPFNLLAVARYGRGPDPAGP